MYTDKKVAERHAADAESMMWQTADYLSADVERLLSDLYDITGEANEAGARAKDTESMMWQTAEALRDERARSERLASLAHDTSVELTGALAQADTYRKENEGLTATVQSQATELEQKSATIVEMGETIGNLNEEINGFVAAQGENIDRIIELEDANSRLTAENENMAQAGADMAYDLRKTTDKLARVTSERDMYKAGVEDLRYEISGLTDDLEILQERLDVVQGTQDFVNHKLTQGRKIARLNGLLKTMSAHLEYTLEEIESGKYSEEQVAQFREGAEELHHHIITVGGKDLRQVTIDDLDMFFELERAIYGKGAGLPKATKAQLREIAESQYTLRNK